jgi:hypothetical protein
MWHEPAAYSWKHDRKRSVEVYQEWAERAWLEIVGECPELVGNLDYALGFRDGFVDYVYAGGNGEPPPVPPRQYWNVMLRSPEGKQLADLWFAGYRHGAQIARDGGYRDLGTIRTSLVSAAEPFDQSLYAPMLGEPHGERMDSYGSQPESVPDPRAASDSPALPAPARPPLVEAPFTDEAAEPVVPQQSPESTADPSIDATNSESNSVDPPQDLPLPDEESLGDPFQSEGAFHKAPPAGSETQLVKAESGHAGTLQLQALAGSEPNELEPRSASSTIRLVATPINGPPDNKPRIVVQLTPTPVSQTARLLKRSQPPETVEVQLVSANSPEHPTIEPNESTIRIRNGPAQRRPHQSVVVPIRSMRKPKFVRQTLPE